MIIIDRFTGKPIPRPSDALPRLNGGKCDVCGTPTIDHCIRCGAPQCCPKCCQEGENDSTAERQHEMRRDGTRYLCRLEFESGRIDWAVLYWGVPAGVSDPTLRPGWLYAPGGLKSKFKRILDCREVE